jgi:hypothetical protein
MIYDKIINFAQTDFFKDVSAMADYLMGPGQRTDNGIIYLMTYAEAMDIAIKLLLAGYQLKIIA